MFIFSCFPIFLIQVPIPVLKLAQLPLSLAASRAVLPSISNPFPGFLAS